MEALPVPPLHVRIGRIALDGDLGLPSPTRALLLFAHGSGSTRKSPRNIQVAQALGHRGFATLLFDLLAPQEAGDRARTFDIDLLSGRLVEAIGWVDQHPALAALPLALFGASTGAAAALRAAAALPDRVYAVVSRGGRPDLAADALPRVRAPTLLIVGERDTEVLALNRAALRRMPAEAELVIIPGATHLFEEPGALAQVADHAARWFDAHLPTLPARPRGRGAAG